MIFFFQIIKQYFQKQMLVEKIMYKYFCNFIKIKIVVILII